MSNHFKAVLTFIIASVIATSGFAQHKTLKKKSAATGGGLTAQTASGQKLYTQYCVSCHQADGGGVQNMNPPLIKTSYVLGDKSKIIHILLKGFSEQVEIEGNYYNNTMPSFDYLKDQQIADVLTYVRNSFGNKASAVKTAEVTKLRAAK